MSTVAVTQQVQHQAQGSQAENMPSALPATPISVAQTSAPPAATVPIQHQIQQAPQHPGQQPQQQQHPQQAQQVQQQQQPVASTAPQVHMQHPALSIPGSASSTPMQQAQPPQATVQHLSGTPVPIQPHPGVQAHQAHQAHQAALASAQQALQQASGLPPGVQFAAPPGMTPQSTFNYYAGIAAAQAAAQAAVAASASPAPTTPGGSKAPVGSDEWLRQRRENHKEVERRRRETINEGINELAKLIPEGEKNKGKILSRAVQYIHELKQQQSNDLEKWTLEKLLCEQAIQELSAQVEALKQENEQLRSQLALQATEPPRKKPRKEGEEHATGELTA